MGFAFGSFNEICQTAALIVCPLLGSSNGLTGISPTCYSRNVELAKTVIFQPATCFMHIVALIMLLIMVRLARWLSLTSQIFHVRTKYTAVGRKEILLFFYLYGVITLLALFLDSGIIPTSSPTYPWFAAVYTAFVAAMFWCLLVNGFVGFQFAEDGTPLSLWFLRLSSLAIWGIVFFIAIATFKSFAGFAPDKALGLWIIMFVFNGICALVYIVLQLVLVLRTLDDRWPIGDILFGTAFFAVALVITFAFSVTICDAVKHYLDGLFFSTLANLLAVMMIYKYWDSITKDDLEFSVASKKAVWDVAFDDDLAPAAAHGAGGHGAYGYPPQAGTPAKSAW